MRTLLRGVASPAAFVARRIAILGAGYDDLAGLPLRNTRELRHGLFPSRAVFFVAV